MTLNASIPSRLEQVTFSAKQLVFRLRSLIQPSNMRCFVAERLCPSFALSSNNQFLVRCMTTGPAVIPARIVNSIPLIAALVTTEASADTFEVNINTLAMACPPDVVASISAAESVTDKFLTLFANVKYDNLEAHVVVNAVLLMTGGRC